MSKNYNRLCGLIAATVDIPMRIIESLDIPDVNLTGNDSAQKIREFQKRFSKEMMSSSKLKPRLFYTFDDLQKEILQNNTY